MTTVAYWIQRQRKHDLQNLAAQVGMKGYDTMLKSELEVALSEYLRTNQSQLQNDPSLSPFYKRMGTPVKRESGGAAASTSVVEDVKKPKQRRQTIKAREELGPLSDTEPSLPLATTTPATPLSSSLARQIPLPASPSQLADTIEAQTASITNSISDFYTTSPIPTYLTSIRSTLSSVTSVQLMVLSLELFGILRRVVPMKYLTTLPPVPAVGLHSEIPLKLPDLFALLTSEFWGPVGLWMGTSVLIPSLAAWVINLRGAERAEGGYDPVIYAVVKGLVGWVIYVKGGVEGQSMEVVNGSVPGGAVGMLLGAAVVGLGGVYEAVLRK
ncbi:MAG: hypothetical protein Q9220_003776 [cf. Caloplaca sp. 1 TL-2023]